MFVDEAFRSVSRFESLVRTRSLLLIVLTIWAVLARPTQAVAHVKWFCDYDVAGQPLVLGQVFNTDFLALLILALSALMIGYMLDRTRLGESISRSLDRITSLIRAHSGLVIRAAGGFFLIALWTTGGTLLTPELKTSSTLVPQFQLAMAASLLSRQTSAFAGLGIFVLFGLALHDYGLFHLLDYPIFLGIAAYLIINACWGGRPLRVQPLELLRWSAAVTLMWASIEKWAYPEWTLPIYVSHPGMSMGFNFEFFMQSAGVIEFTLAFALLWTPLVRRAAAFILLGMFIGATAEFGKVDVIGHSMIVAVLLVVAADDSRLTESSNLNVWSVTKPSLGYAATLLAFLSLYYGLHAFLFKTAIV